MPYNTATVDKVEALLIACGLERNGWEVVREHRERPGIVLVADSLERTFWCAASELEALASVDEGLTECEWSFAVAAIVFAARRVADGEA